MAKKIYFPRIFGGKGKPSGTSPGKPETPEKPEVPVETPEEIELNTQELAFFKRMFTHKEQGRNTLLLHPILMRVARAKARDMGERDYFSHMDLNGYGPNWHVRQAGYRLPDWYGKENDANSIESIGAGRATAEAQWEGWMNSPGHRVHVLGENSFYAEQTNVGIAFVQVEGSHFNFYWVLLTCP